MLFLVALHKHAKAFAKAVKGALMPGLATFAKPEPEERLDASSADVGAAMRRARAAANAADNKAAMKAAADRAARGTVINSQVEFKRLGIKLLDAEPKLGPMITTWRKQTVDRIVSVDADQLGKVERILREGGTRRVESIAKDLEYQLDEVSLSRATLIARDQVLTLNALVTKERQGACGIESYVWTTSNDERVREEHVDLEGETFQWDDPPEEGHPGDAILCRCVAFPILPELEEEGLE